MKLDLWRKPPDGDATIGELEIDGAFEAFTLEDLPHPTKIKGRTRIPAGTYAVTITWSPRFGRNLPLVEDVPGFEGIRIHPGNTAEDTEGCILVGTQAGEAVVLNSRVAFLALFAKLEQAISNHDNISITIHDGQRA